MATENDWDENVISTFLTESKTTEHAVDLTRSGGKLLYVTQDLSIDKIASQTDALFSWLGTPADFTLILFMRDDPRHITATTWPSRRSVNGGFTSPGSNTIVVYRAEEWDRVLIHEVIHALHWDWEVPSDPMPCWGLGPQARLAPHLFEAWTELYAEWLFCGWHNKSWSAQCDWMKTQAIQILARAPRVWNENTNIFAYYILKAALAPHIAFLWTLQNGMSDTIRTHVLCNLVEPALTELRRLAATTTPVALSLRMTHP